MLFQCRSQLKAFLKNPKIQRVLEIGSGHHSTPLIAKRLQQGKIKQFVSLENIPDWRDAIQQKHGFTPTLSKFKFIDGIFRYKYEVKNQFITDPQDVQHLQDFCNQDSVCLSSVLAAGIQSAHMIEYLRPAIHDNTVVMLDGRRGSALHYVCSYSTEFDFEFLGKPYDKQELKSILKPEYQHLAQWPLSEIVIMRRKNENV